MSLSFAAGAVLAELPDHKGEVWEYRLAAAAVPGAAWACSVLKRDGAPAGQETAYQVCLSREGRWSCSCPDYVYRRRKRGEVCKHVAAAQELREAQIALGGAPC